MQTTPVQFHRPALCSGTARWRTDDVEALFELPFNELLFRAQTVHREHFDPSAVQLSTLLSIKTGGCPENCAYCPQSAHFDTGVDATALMALDEVLEAARRARQAGATRFCMGAAWRGPKDRDIEKVAALVAGVKSLGLETCATLGMLGEGHAEACATRAWTTTTTTSTARRTSTPTSSARGNSKTASIRCARCAAPA